MARYLCPSCGRRYNGKRCANCLYENFAEEYSHGSHTHTGEPLVIRDTQRRPIPRKDPFACEEKTRKPGLRPLVLVIILLSVIVPVAKAVIGIVSEISSKVSDSFVSVSSRKADAVMPSGGITLYDDGSLRIVADWEETRKFDGSLRVVVENHTRQDLNVTTKDLLVNDYVMNYSSIYISADAGHTAEGWLYLDDTDLEDAGISDVQQICASFQAYDSDSYETIMQTAYIPLCTASALIQPPADQGETLYERDGIRIVCKGYAPSSYDPEDFSEGDILFYLENGTDAAMEIFADEVTVNGQETLLSLWSYLPPHTQTVRRMSLFSLSSGKTDIPSRDDITEMTVSFFFQADDESAAFTTDPVSIPFQLDWTK